MKEFGIDVSTWQGADSDFVKAKNNSGVKFVYIRAGFGREASQKDNAFEAHYKNAKNAGLKVGAYWYSYAISKEDAIKEANACIACLKGKQFELPIFYDIEEYSILSKSASELKDIISAFCDTLLKNGYYAGVYCGFAVTDKVGTSFMNKYPVWFAQWYKECQYTGKYGVWQYTDKAYVDGFGEIDGDYQYVDYTTYIKQNGYNGFPKTPDKPEDLSKKSNLTLAFEVIDGKYGAGDVRKQKLGNRYSDVQDVVNALLIDTNEYIALKDLYKKGIIR